VAPPATNRENHEGRGEGSEEVFTPRVGVSFLGASAKNIPLESPGKGKGEVFTLGLPYPCSQRPKKKELSPAATVPPPLQRLVAPIPWNLEPVGFQPPTSGFELIPKVVTGVRFVEGEEQTQQAA
jgi:hypothetical protein